MIYHTNSAAYGRVRTASGFSEDKKGVLDTVINCGWHDVNDLYRISRPEGTTNFLLLFTLSGTGAGRIGENLYELTQDTMLIIPPFVFSEYYTQAQKHWSFYWIHFDGKNVSLILNDIIQQYGNLLSLPAVKVSRYLTELMDDKKSFQDEALDVAQTVSQLLFGISYAAKEHQMKGQAPDVVNEIINTIRSAYTEPFSLSVISKKYYLSVEHDLNQFFETVDAAEAADIVQKWKTEAADVLEPSDADILESAKLYLALRQMRDELNADALTVDCLTLSYGDKYTNNTHMYPCLSHAEMSRRGEVAVCEADINATLASLVTLYLTAGQVMYPTLLLIHRLIKLYMHTALPVQKSMERMTRAHANII
ncbi:AraC family ligand binding domain-containing protein [Hungatella hathewayi]|uniref:AraC family ligand binding domain-containing protein n=1 Tax=Hungatella hathewayi TaxID=154046 RepID=UPI00356598E4